MSPEEVCDAVFGSYTKDGPSLRKGTAIYVTSTLKHEWSYWFEGPRADWYLEWPGRD